MTVDELQAALGRQHYVADRALAGGASDAEAAAVADQGTEPSADLNASADYRRHLARVLVGRALAEAS